MPQFSIPPGGRVGGMVRLSAADSKHLTRVLRAKVGDKIRLFDGTSRFEAQVISLSPKEATAKIRSLLIVPLLQGEVTLCQALLKRDKMEWIIQKGAELGLHRLTPFVSSRAIPREAGDVKLSRWQKIADEALKQCGRVQPMKVEHVVEFGAVLKDLPIDAAKILVSPEGEKSPLAPLRQRGAVTLFVGPEGGFSDNEIQIARHHGCLIRSMGALTLRAETAAIAALTLIQHELGNL